MREIVFDTETTGLDPASGDRITEIGALELVNKIPTGKTYQQYINPECTVSEASVAITGLTNEFLKDFPVFADVYQSFVDFVGDDILVAHNADFDMRFLNHHLADFGIGPYPASRVVDTLKVARKNIPGGRHSLDALCKRFEIDNSNRTLHGALLDAELLAEVYLELCGGRQHGLTIDADAEGGRAATVARPQRPPRTFHIPPAERAAHQDFLLKLTDPIWGASDGQAA